MQLTMFGKVQLEGSSFSRPKPLLILSYLTLTGPQERRKLAELFWADDAGVDPKKALQKKLGKLSVVLAQFKKSDANEVFSYESGLNPLPSKASSDAHLFLEAIEQENYQTAVDLYKGAFLEDTGKSLDKLDLHQDIHEWVLDRREYYAVKAQEVMLVLAEQQQQNGNNKEAKELAERAYNLKEAPEPEPSILNRLNKLLSETGSELEDSLESDVEASLEELTETSLKVFLALALQDKPNLTVIKNALKLSLGELDEAREELILNGLINIDTQILAQHMARNWLVERPTERMPLLLALARNTPPEKAYSIYKGIYEKTQGFGGMGDLNRARKAYCKEAQKLMDALEFAKAAELLAEARKVEEVLEAEPEAESRFIEAYALERQGQFKEALVLINALPQEEHNPNVVALKSVLLWRNGKSNEATQAAQEVLCSGLEWSWAKGLANMSLGYLASSNEAFNQAASYFKKASSFFRVARDNNRLVGSLNNLAIELDKMAEFEQDKNHSREKALGLREQAKEVYLEALAQLAKGRGNHLLQARVLLNLGMLWEREGDWKQAEVYYLQAIPLAETENALEIVARLKLNLGMVYLAERKTIQAKTFFEQSIEAASVAGEYLIQGSALGNLAFLNEDLDAMEIAMELLEQSGNTERLRFYMSDYETILHTKLEKAILANNIRQSQELFLKLKGLYQKQDLSHRFEQVEDALKALSQTTELEKSKDLLMAYVKPLESVEKFIDQSN